MQILILLNLFFKVHFKFLLILSFVLSVFFFCLWLAAFDSLINRFSQNCLKIQIMLNCVKAKHCILNVIFVIYTTKKPDSNVSDLFYYYGGLSRNRTGMNSHSVDFESTASTSSAMRPNVYL